MHSIVVEAQTHLDRTKPVHLPECAEYISDCGVRLVEDEPNQMCIQGMTFGCRSSPSGGSAVWVNMGCNGTFDLGSGTQRLKCASEMGAMHICAFGDIVMTEINGTTFGVGKSSFGLGKSHPRRLEELDSADMIKGFMDSTTMQDKRKLGGIFAIAPADGGGRDFAEWLNATEHPWASNVRLFDSAEAVEAHLTGTGYPERDLVLNTSSRLCGAVVFDTLPESEEVRYTLRFNATLAPDPNLPPLVQTFMQSKIKTGVLVGGAKAHGGAKASSFDESGLKWYTQSGFLAIQRTVDTFLGQLADAEVNGIGDSADSGTFRGGASSYIGEDGRPHLVAPFPTTGFQRDIFAMLMPNLLASFLMISLAYSVNRMITALVHEREARLRDGMRMMGMHPMAFYLSWIITYMAVYLFVCTGVVACLTFGKVLPHSSPSLLWIWLMLFAAASISYALVISTFFTKAKTAATVGSVAFFASSYFAQLASSSSSPRFLRAISMLPPVCFELAAQTIADMESQAIGVTWLTMDTPFKNFSLLDGIGMLALDAVVLLLLFLYLDQVAPREIGLRRPWYFPLQASFWRDAFSADAPEAVINDAAGGAEEDDVEAAPESSSLVERDIGEAAAAMARNGQTVELKKLSKKFGELHAVKGLDLLMLQGEIFALLGHNGAGKTTTLAMLCGLMPPTRGRCMIFGHDLQREPAQVQRLLGVCPQHDVLWESLTCEEHLALFAGFKGVPAAQVEAEVASMLQRVGLEAAGAVRTRAGSLSGGMKRKLSLGIAFLGGSRLVVLDEPTSGLDPYSRRTVWELLRAMKQGRVTILSTHYMDEADILGDRIAILHEGALRCCGSPQFLKRAYDCGYNVTFVKRPGCQTDAIVEAVCKHMPELASEVTLLSESGNELILQFPFAASQHFPKVLGGLEAQMTELCIESYGVSVTTLEEVFLKVASGERLGLPASSVGSPSRTPAAAPAAAARDGGGAAVGAESASEDERSGQYIELQDAGTPRNSFRQARESGFGRAQASQKAAVGAKPIQNRPRKRGAASRCSSHLSALLLKRVRYGLRDRRGFLCQLCLPSATLVLLLCLVSSKLFHNQPPLELDPKGYNEYCQGSPQNSVDFSHLASVKPRDAEELLIWGKPFWNGELRHFLPPPAGDAEMAKERFVTSSLPGFLHMMVRPSLSQALLLRGKGLREALREGGAPNLTSSLQHDLAKARAAWALGDEEALDQDLLKMEQEIEEKAPDIEEALKQSGFEVPDLEADKEGADLEDASARLPPGVKELRSELEEALRGQGSADNADQEAGPAGAEAEKKLAGLMKALQGRLSKANGGGEELEAADGAGAQELSQVIEALKQRLPDINVKVAHPDGEVEDLSEEAASVQGIPQLMQALQDRLEQQGQGLPTLPGSSSSDRGAGGEATRLRPSELLKALRQGGGVASPGASPPFPGESPASGPTIRSRSRTLPVDRQQGAVSARRRLLAEQRRMAAVDAEGGAAAGADAVDPELETILERDIARSALEAWSTADGLWSLSQDLPFVGAIASRRLRSLSEDLGVSSAGGGGPGSARRLQQAKQAPQQPPLWLLGRPKSNGTALSSRPGQPLKILFDRPTGRDQMERCDWTSSGQMLVWTYLDQDRSGKIDRDEAREIFDKLAPKRFGSPGGASSSAAPGEAEPTKLRDEAQDVLVQAFFLAVDRDGDGAVSENEFCTVSASVERELERYTSIATHFSEQLLKNPSSCPRYGAYFVLHEPRSDHASRWDTGADAAIFVNTTSAHAAGVFQSVLSNARFARHGFRKRVSVRTHPFPQTQYEQHSLEQLAVFLLAIYITFCLSFIPAGITNFAVKERVSGAQQLQLLSGASFLTFWLANLIYDLALYVVPALCVPLCLRQFGFEMMLSESCGQALIAILAAFGPAVAGFSYLVSFMFRDHSKASNAILTFCLVGASVLSTVLFILTIINYDPTYAWPVSCDHEAPGFPDGNCAFPRAKQVERVLTPLFRMVPTVCVYQALVCIALVANLKMMIPKGAEEALAGIMGGAGGMNVSTDAFAWEYAGAPLAYLCVEGFAFFFATVLLDICLHSPRVARFFDAAVFSRRAGNMLKFRGRRATPAVEGGGASLIESSAQVETKLGDNSVEVERERTALVLPQDAALHVWDLEKTYRRWSAPWVAPKHAVRGVSFAVHGGEVFGLLGHNGAGKTSALKCLVGELGATTGAVHVGGHSMESDSGRARRRIGYCPQFDALLELLTVRDHLELFAPLKQLPKETIAEALVNFKLEKMANRRADLLSGGNKRKLSAALALIGGPSLAILDEPSCGLDPAARRALWSAVQNAVAGTTALPGIGLFPDLSAPSAVLLTTHSMEEAEALSTRLGIMAEGKLLTVGTAQQIKQRHGACHELCFSLRPESDQDLRAGLQQLGGGALQPSTPLGAELVLPLIEADAAKKRAYVRARCIVRSQIEAAGHVEAAVLAEWWLQQTRGEQIERFLVGLVGEGVDLAENFGPLWRFRLPHGGQGLPQLFGQLEEHGPELGIAEYTLSQATLEQIFNSIAGEVDEERQLQIQQSAQQTSIEMERR